MAAEINNINENECIGDSLVQINKNFDALKIIVDTFKTANLTNLTSISQSLQTLKDNLNNLPS
jgi:hypothetical protein